VQENSRVTAAEVARLAGVGRAAVSNWRKRHPDFPAPVGGSSTSPEFDLGQVEQWLRAHGKLAEVPTAERVWQRLGTTGDRLPTVLAEIGILLARRGQTGGAQCDSETEDADPAVVDVLPDLGRLVDDCGLAAAYDQLLQRLSRPTSARAWATPDDLADLMAELAGVRGKEVFDPACGAGSLMRAAVRAGAARVDGQDIHSSLAVLTALWLDLHRLPGDVETGDALHSDAFPGRLFDAVLCHPPFNTSHWGQEKLDPADPRWSYGLPPRTEPELAWVLHVLAHLRPGGRAVLLMPPAVASRRAGRRIRAALLRRGNLRAVITLPAGAAAPHGVPLHLWVLRQPLADEPVAPRTLLIDAADSGGREVASVYARVRETFHRFAAVPDEEIEESGFAHAVPVIELLDEEVDLTPARRQAAVSSVESSTQLRGIHDRLTAVVNELPGLMPRFEPNKQAPPPVTVTVAELLRTDTLQLIGPVRTTAREAAEQTAESDALVLTVQDVLAGESPSGRDVQRLARQVPLLPGDVVVPMVSRRLAARVVTDGGALLGLNLYLLRPDPAAWDPWFLAGQLRTSSNEKQASSLSGALRFDIRRAQVRRLPLEEQRAYGDAMRRLEAFESAIRQVAGLGTDLVQLIADGLAGGVLAPGETPAEKEE